MRVEVEGLGMGVEVNGFESRCRVRPFWSGGQGFGLGLGLG